MTSEWSGRTEWRGVDKRLLERRVFSLPPFPPAPPETTVGHHGGRLHRRLFRDPMKSDIIYETEYKGALTQEKYCICPPCGLILLTSVENAERAVEVPQVPGLGADPEDDLIAQFRV